MPSFEVLLNDKPIVVAGGNDVDILTFGVISGPGSPDAFLQITSMKKATEEHDLWINRELSLKDVLTVILRPDDASIPTTPLKDSSLENSQTGVDANSRRRACFLIRFPDKKKISARVNDEATLHVAATWTKSKGLCCLEVACIRMTDEGQNEMLLEYEMEYDQPLQIEVN
jgi:hypothetical protein